LQIPGAWLGAALWALHPVEVESVAWIAETKNTESGLFFLLSTLFFVRWLRAKDLDERTGSGWNYALTIFFAALAMASKSSTVILPMVLCLCAWWVEGRWQWRNLARVAPILFMSAVSTALAVRTVDPQDVNINAQWAISWPERLVVAGDAVWFYLDKLIWPHPLITIYPRWEIDARQWISYLPLLAVIIVLFILWLKRESWSRPWFFVFAYFLVALLPVLGLVDHFILRYSFVFDHFQYLADMGPLALAGAGLTRFLDFTLSGRRWLQMTICALTLLVLGVVSWDRSWAYKNAGTLWTDSLAKNPNCWSYNNLGNFLWATGRLNEAMVQFQKALEINPRFFEAHDNVGSVLFQEGHLDEAMIQFQKALEINPNYASAHNNIGNFFLKKRRLDEAIVQYQKALENDPALIGIHNNLGVAFLQQGKTNEAIAQFQELLRLDPNFTLARNNLALAQTIIKRKSVPRTGLTSPSN
jgi:tetratricopeptide (TPR) repeat protein